MALHHTIKRLKVMMTLKIEKLDRQQQIGIKAGVKILSLLSIIISCNAFAHEQNRSTEYLHHYGIAYCLSKSEIYQQEANLARGGYFQLGEHSLEAQIYIQHYIDEQLDHELGGYQDSDLKAYLMRCLEISYTQAYQAQVNHALELEPLE